MVDIDLINGLKIDGAAEFSLVAVHVIGECSFEAVENEPAFVPRLELLTHLEHVAATRVCVYLHERLLCVRVYLVHELMAAVLDVLTQVEVVVAYR